MHLNEPLLVALPEPEVVTRGTDGLPVSQEDTHVKQESGPSGLLAVEVNAAEPAKNSSAKQR